MYLPNEIILAILENLEGKHLKSARLVCKTWCSYASGFLFDRIYIAPNKVDLEVFDAITQHPVLSKCVRHLVYDTSKFVPGLTKDNYIHGLWMQTAALIDMEKLGLDNPDPHIIDWINDVANRRFPLKQAVAKWKDDGFIKRGYKVYEEHSIYQQGMYRGPKFMENFVSGLSRLVGLKSVSLELGWPFLVRPGLDQNCNGTPLARRWNPLHYGPQKSRPWSRINEAVGKERYYCILINALFHAQKHVDAIFIGKSSIDGISHRAFDMVGQPRLIINNASIVALSGVKRLCLCIRIDHVRYSHYIQARDSIDGLPELLGSVHSLQQLELDFSGKALCPLFTYDQIFPQAMTWNHIEKLSLSGVSSSARKLLCLLLIQMPGLRHVEFGDIGVKGGCWETVIECLKQTNQSTVYEFRRDAKLRWGRAKAFRQDQADIIEYIMHGGRHPCLSDDQPTSASEEYTTPPYETASWKRRTNPRTAQSEPLGMNPCLWRTAAWHLSVPSGAPFESYPVTHKMHLCTDEKSLVSAAKD